MAVTVRPVASNEKEIWNQLFQAYADFYKVESTQEKRDAVWGWIFDDNENFWCAVAENDEGEIVGFTQYQLMHRSLGGGMTCYLSDLYTNPAIRGFGAGRAMIDYVLAFAKDLGFPNVMWLTQEFNYTARKVYDTYAAKSDFIAYRVPVG
jgi:GNAT superfamily N-acetyltransferase